ncbi:MAG: hypothetical protein ACKOAS_08695, partial [Verrucomicrobiota bacterium]
MNNTPNNPHPAPEKKSGPDSIGKKLFAKVSRVARRLVLPGAAILGLVLVVWLVFAIKGAAQAGGTVTLLFFDRNGTALTPTQVRSLSNNGG